MDSSDNKSTSSQLTSGNSLSGGRDWELRVGVVGGVESSVSAAATSLP